MERWDADDRLGLQIVATRSIDEGEELFLDYALTVDDGAYLCLCGAQRCRGTMAAG